MTVLKVESLCKSYPSFKLKDVSFQLDAGTITGFIGRNGAGKTTTLKSMLNFVHPDSGKIYFFGKNAENETSGIKQDIGFVSGGADFYPKKKLKTITGAVKKFYKNWSDDDYQKYMKQFSLDENKTPDELSAGMNVKYALALALSHKARLLILDEPTSGLDPVSREEILDIFLALKDEGVTVLFSTHITSDLEKTADKIIYIQNGTVIADKNIEAFTDEYMLAQLCEADLSEKTRPLLIGCKRAKHGYTALIKKSDAQNTALNCAPASLEDIMVHFEKEQDE